MTEFADLQWKVFPRLWAFSEVAWTDPEKRLFSFLAKIKKFTYSTIARTWY